MAFELVARTASEAIDVADELLFDVARILQLPLRLLHRLEVEFYDSPTFSTPEAVTLGEELALLAKSLAAEPHAAHRAWAARPPAFRSQVMTRPPDVGAMVAKIEALARTCRDAAVHGGILKGLSD
jgi:hypothetical protein